MIRYIIASFIRFKNEVLSKLIYDVFKLLIPIIAVFIVLKWRELLWVGLLKRVDIPFYLIVIYTLFIALVTVVIAILIFRKKYQRLQSDNFTDELTGLKNYKALQKYLPERISQLSNSNETMSLIIIDIDNFRKFNADCGYNTSDKVLKKLGELLNNDKRITD